MKSSDAYSRWSVQLRWVTSLAIGAALVLYLSSERLLHTLARADVSWIVAALALAPVGWALQWLKWRALLQVAVPNALPSLVTRSLLAGFALGAVSPGRLGELGRGLFVPGARAMATALAVADRAVSFAVTLMCAAMVLPWLLQPSRWILPLASITAIVVAVWIRRRELIQFVGRFYSLRRMGQTLTAMDRSTLATVSALSLLFNLTFFVQLYLLLASFAPVPPASALAIPLVFGAKALAPVGIMDLGVREGAALLVLSPFGVDPAVAVQAALLLFAMNVLPPSVAGLAWMVPHCRSALAPGAISQ
ncbi:MAG: lysylphosphatidylglycerol synthase transmembrane domain-containing protein [Candidatus Latescibacterota bacterium]|nr:lysylphosphatidylglycerol synthase transmembrane domain-containing protein [Candidatus Latescibacterota bacterium]